MKTLPPGKPTLYLVDGSSYLYRAFFAIRALSNSAGQPTNAVYGFAVMLRKLRKDHRPDLLAVCFDRKEKTERHEAFEAYKATRKPMPDELAVQIDPIKELIRAHQIPVIEMAGQEADDLMGTLAMRAKEADYRAILVTADKDMLQLVDGGDVLEWHTGKEEFWGREEVIREWGVPPERIIDVLSIMGDSSDNIPGVKGIGEKGAVELVQAFGSLEDIYEKLGSVSKPALRKKLEEGRSSAEMSKSLVTIRTDLDVPFDVTTLRVRPPDEAALLSIYRRCEFRKLAEELAAEVAEIHASIGAHGNSPLPDSKPDSISSPPAASPPVDIRWAESPGELSRLLDAASRQIVSLHAAGEGEGWITSPAVAALSVEPGQALAFPLRGAGAADWVRAVASSVREKKIDWISDDSKRVIHLFGRLGETLPDPSGDLALASYVLRPGGRGHAFADVLLDRAGERAVNEKEALGKEGWIGFTGESAGAAEGVLQLAGEPAARTAALLAPIEKELDAEKLSSVYRELELPLVSVLAKIERRGIKLDVPYLKTLSDRLFQELGRLEKEIHELAGEEFNVSSPLQLGRILFEKLGYTATRKTAKTKAYATGVDVLEGLADEGKPIASKILEQREISKLKGTYVDSLPRLVDEEGVLHTSFRQTVAATGRLSSSDPNLQNIPIRTELGREIRRAFVARPGCHLLSADYSQIELRLLAHMSGDPDLIQAFRSGIDIHAATASRVFGVLPDLVSAEMRRSAKTINFGILYGMGAFSLARDLGIPTREAKAFIESYFEQFPTVRAFLDKTLESARADKQVRTLFGRVRRLPDIASSDRNVRANAERMAINAPLQGTAADLMKIALIRVEKALRTSNSSAEILLTVHDELLLEVREEELLTTAKLVREEMEGVAELLVPLVVDVGSGDNWLAAK